MTWAFSKNGMYTVKTAYMLGKGCNLDNFHQVWVDIWSFEASPKVRHFLWRARTQSLPTRALLHHRHFIEDATCLRGCGEFEIASHAIFECPFISQLWIDIRCHEMCNVNPTVSMCEVVMGWGKLIKKKQSKGAFLAWGIWDDRNNIVSTTMFSPMSYCYAVLILDRWTEEHGQYAAYIYSHAQHKPASGSKIWCLPPTIITKFNVDASLAIEGWVGLGVIARNCQGKVLSFLATRWMRAYWSPRLQKRNICNGFEAG